MEMMKKLPYLKQQVISTQLKEITVQVDKNYTNKQENRYKKS